MTPQQAKDEFIAKGECPAHWADQHGFSRSLTYQVLNGRSAMRRGEAHQIAVKLGIKPDPVKHRT
jgi:gp16 family phage-associated protein